MTLLWIHGCLFFPKEVTREKEAVLFILFITFHAGLCYHFHFCHFNAEWQTPNHASSYLWETWACRDSTSSDKANSICARLECWWDYQSYEIDTVVRATGMLAHLSKAFLVTDKHMHDYEFMIPWFEYRSKILLTVLFIMLLEPLVCNWTCGIMFRSWWKND